MLLADSPIYEVKCRHCDRVLIAFVSSAIPLMRSKLREELGIKVGVKTGQ